ncbi:MAG: asparagine synthetase B, partial [Deltaproteobacteria bacterium]|nr:asparagine synthetase B [Deltaproteobacteria bacterium]
MCGIAGRVNRARERAVDPGRLAEAIHRMAHRGPDGEGLYFHENAGLGHRRLSIIDLATGGQPLCNEDRTLWVTFNGEIYNHALLREELVALGHRFATRSDT